VYSVTDAESFLHVQKLYAQLLRSRGGDKAPRPRCILVGNKADLASKDDGDASHRAAVGRSEAELFAREVVGCPLLEVTAKSRYEADNVFTTLVRAVVAARAPIKDPAPSHERHRPAEANTASPAPPQPTPVHPTPKPPKPPKPPGICSRF
jgi:hypothetical protein